MEDAAPHHRHASADNKWCFFLVSHSEESLMTFLAKEGTSSPAALALYSLAH